MKRSPLLALPEFLLDTPLYQWHELSNDLLVLSYIYGKKTIAPFDGYCPGCNKETTYTLSRCAHIPNSDPWRDIKDRISFENIEITCARDESHTATFYLFLCEMEIQKIGQFPSLADIENNKHEIHRKNMSPIDSKELYKAIGLAAHGVGIGSFVYLRRIMERIIMEKFNENKGMKGWNEQQFESKRIGERIEFLKEYLPEFLVSNKKIHSILSLGIHQLSEEQCIAIFNVLKRSIIYILEEDIRKKERLTSHQELENAIASFDLTSS